MLVTICFKDHAYNRNWLVLFKPKFNKKVSCVFQFFGFYLIFWIFDETLTLVTFLTVEQTNLCCCQKETYQSKLHIKLDWTMVLGESFTIKIWLFWLLQHWLVLWWDWKKPQNRDYFFGNINFLDNGTKQNIKLWLVLVATYIKIKMRYPWYILYVSVI